MFGPTYHSLSDLYEKVTPASVFVLYLLVVIVMVILRLLRKCFGCKRCVKRMADEVDDIVIGQQLANFYSSLKSKVRESLIREEVQDFKRLQTSKFSRDMLCELIMAPKVDKSLRLHGDASYRILRHPIA